MPLANRIEKSLLTVTNILVVCLRPLATFDPLHLFFLAVETVVTKILVVVECASIGHIQVHRPITNVGLMVTSRHRFASQYVIHSWLIIYTKPRHHT